MASFCKYCVFSQIKRLALIGKNVMTIDGDKCPEYVLTVARRPLEIATGYLNFQLVAQIGYWNKIMYFYM